MEKEWEVEDELYSWKDSLGLMLVQQTSFPRLKECDVEARALCRAKGQVGSYVQEGREEIWTNSSKQGAKK